MQKTPFSNMFILNVKVKEKIKNTANSSKNNSSKSAQLFYSKLYPRNSIWDKELYEALKGQVYS